jgi:hypothetical protein
MNSPENDLSNSETIATQVDHSLSPDSSMDTTLRLIARLAPPAGLEDRIHAGLRAEMHRNFKLEMPRARVLVWPASASTANRWLHSSLIRTAAAMAIVAVVLGGGWVISSRVQLATTAKGGALPNRVAGPGGFSTAGAMRTPQTLHGPVVLPVLVPPSTVAVSPLKGKPSKKPLLPNAPGTQNKEVSATPPALHP